MTASWTKPFLNILNLEESRGFADKAVTGGMDKFVQRWSSDLSTAAGIPAPPGFF